MKDRQVAGHSSKERTRYMQSAVRVVHTPRRARSASRQVERGRRSRARLGTTYQATATEAKHISVQPILMRRWKIRRHQAVGLAILLALSSVIGYLFISPDWYVWGAEISDCQWLRKEEIYQAAGIDGHSIFYVDPEEISERVEQLPGIEHAEVVCRLPNQVSIRVVEREPAVIWQNQGIQYWADRAGILFQRSADLEDPVIIVDQEPVARQPGDRVDASAIRTALELHQLLPDVRIFAYSKAEGLTFDLANGRRVLVQVGCDSHKVVSALYELQEHLGSQNIGARVIDLRYENRAYWR